MSAATVPYAVAARDLLRTTLLDAVREELGRQDWADVTMADVARTAGVSRQTLYKHFRSRDELAQAFVLRESERFLAQVEDAVRARAADPPRALEAALEVFLSAAAEDPFVRAVVLGEELLALVTTQGQPLVEGAAQRLTDVVVDCWPQVSRGDAGLLAETLVRLGISYATLPRGHARATAASVRRLLEPFVERVLAQA